MRVLFLIWNYWPGIEGGSERQARQVATELASRGHSCTIWTAWLDRKLAKLEVKDGTTIVRFGNLVPLQSKLRIALDVFHRFAQKILGKVFTNIDKEYALFKNHFDFWFLLPVVYIARWSFMKEVRARFNAIEAAPDIIHLHEPSWLGGFAVQLAERWETPVLCQEATNPALPVLGYDVPGRKRIDKCRRDAHFIAMAPYLKNDLIEKKISNKKIHVVPNGVKIPCLKDARQESPLILYVGNFSQGAHWKGFDVLFEAWKVIHARNIGLQLVVLGGGDRSAWEKYVEQLGCADTVDFMGRVSDPEEFYRKAAIFVLPSRVEGMSNALLEAQSWGIPCVVSDIPGNTSIVEDGVNGIVVPVNDSQALALAVITLYSDPKLKEKIGKSARELMIDRYDSNKVILQLINTYHQILLEDA